MLRKSVENSVLVEHNGLLTFQGSISLGFYYFFFPLTCFYYILCLYSLDLSPLMKLMTVQLEKD